MRLSLSSYRILWLVRRWIGGWRLGLRLGLRLRLRRLRLEWVLLLLRRLYLEGILLRLLLRVRPLIRTLLRLLRIRLVWILLRLLAERRIGVGRSAEGRGIRRL